MADEEILEDIELDFEYVQVESIFAPLDLCRITRLTQVKSSSCGSLPATLRANSFLLCICSPVLKKMLCGNFIESSMKKLKLQDVNKASFCRALDMCCGKQTCAEMELGEVMELACVADKFLMTEILSALDEIVMRHLNLRIRGEVLSWGALIF